MAATATAKSFDISHLPSLKDGMTVEQETVTRRKTCRFIMEAAKQLKFQSIAISTAMVFFHRFYAKHSFKTHDRFEVAVAAILLAGKTEETPRKLNSGKNVAIQQRRRRKSQSSFSWQGNDSNSCYFPLFFFSQSLTNATNSKCGGCNRDAFQHREARRYHYLPRLHWIQSRKSLRNSRNAYF